MANTSATASKKVVIVCDWLTNMGGAEKVVLAMHKAFPDAPIYTSVFDPARCPDFASLDIRTTWLQKLPKPLRFKHQLWPVLRSFAFKRLDLSEYDVVLSSASAEAKAVQAGGGATHICYCHTPVRYYWSHYDEYLKDPGFGALNPLVQLVMPGFVRWMRKRDLAAVDGVDVFVANSHEIQKRIDTYYRRHSQIIFPPVDTIAMRPTQPIEKEDYFLIVGRQVPYKRIDLAVKACTKINARLIVIGEGSEHEALKAAAGPTIEFKTGVTDAQKVSYFQKAKGFIFPSLEDFGITPVEALAAGTPVIAYKAGGAFDYINDGINGIFFEEQTTESLVEALERFSNHTFEPSVVAASADAFSEAHFIKALRRLVDTV